MNVHTVGHLCYSSAVGGTTYIERITSYVNGPQEYLVTGFIAGLIIIIEQFDTPIIRH